MLSNRELLHEAVRKDGIADFIRRKVIRSDELKERDLILQEPPSESIDAESIREVLIGVPRNPADQPNLSADGITGGVRLFGVTITGTLDLTDAVREGGGPLPRLEFTRCWFAGRELRMERARIRSLSVRGCAFADLQASEAVIEGPVDLSYARPNGSIAEEPGRCWVVLAGAQIGGRVYAAHSRFCAPKKREAPEWVRYSKHSRYALDLRGTRIKGSLNLRPNLVADGGVCMTLAKIEGSLWLNGAQVRAQEEWAFAADYAEVQGSLYFRPYDGPVQETKTSKQDKPVATKADFKAEGCISLFAAQIGGSVYFEGAKLTAPHGMDRDARWEYRTVINLSTAVIKGHCLFRGWITETAQENSAGHIEDDAVSHFIAVGDVTLAATSIGNDLDFSGATVCSVFANSLKVSGDCDLATYSRAKLRLPRPFRALFRVELEGARINGSLCMDGARVGQAGRAIPAAVVENAAALIGDCELEQRFRAPGPVGSNTGDDIQFSNPQNGIFARGIEILGDCSMRPSMKGASFRFECAGKISMREARIGNSIYMDGAKIVGPKEKTAIDLSGARIGGKASFKTSYDGTPAAGLPFCLWGGEIALKLIGAKVGQELNMNGAKIRGNKIALNAENIEVGGKALLGTFEVSNNQRHDLFQFEAWGKVSLVAATVRLGVDMSGAELNGGYRISGTLEQSSATDALDLTLVRTKSLRLRAQRQCIDGPMHSSTVERVFKARERVILRYADIDTDLDCDGSIFDRQLMADFARIGGAVLLKNCKIASGMSRSNTTEDGQREGHVQRDAKLPDLSFNGAKIGGALQVGDAQPSSRLSPVLPDGYASGDNLTPFVVDLRGAHVGVLDDNGGTGWGKDLRLWLEGFRYSRLPESVDLPRLRTASVFNVRRIWDPAWIGEEKPIDSTERGERSSSLWQYRALWLRLQYFDGRRPSNAREFNPDAYEQVIARMRGTGSYEDAKRISSIQLTNNSQNSLRVPRLVWHLFRVLFDYGFSVRRAVITFVFCIATGSAATYLADSRDVLVLNLGAPESRLMTPARNSPVRAVLPQPGEVEDQQNVACGNHIVPALYALDVFVPVLDLKQQEVCSIAPERTGWRVAQGLYSLLGWVVVPLVILTASGLMKRHLEK